MYGGCGPRGRGRRGSRPSKSVNDGGPSATPTRERPFVGGSGSIPTGSGRMETRERGGTRPSSSWKRDCLGTDISRHLRRNRLGFFTLSRRLCPQQPPQALSAYRIVPVPVPAHVPVPVHEIESDSDSELASSFVGPPSPSFLHAEKNVCATFRFRYRHRCSCLSPSAQFRFRHRHRCSCLSPSAHHWGQTLAFHCLAIG